MNLTSKRIVVTGGLGFLGSYLVDELKESGIADVFAPSKSAFDLRIAGDIKKMFNDLKPDVLFHLAAVVGGIGANSERPGEFFFDNAIMGIQLIEYARQFDLEKFINVGTICSYPKFTPVPFKEKDLWSGYPEETNAPYGLAKKMMLVQGQAYRKQYDMNVINLLLVNLFGPRDNFDLNTSHVIPAMIRKFDDAVDSGKSEVILWGDGSPTREFLFVQDAAKALIMAAERYDGEEPVNIGSGHEITIKTLATLISNEMGYSGKITWDTSKPNGQPRRCLDVSKAKQLFGFSASYPFEAGIKATIQWYLQQAEKSG